MPAENETSGERSEDIVERTSKPVENSLQQPASTDVDTDQSPPSEGPGAIIGQYKILQEIGRGGFGIVYMAEQLRPIRRRVALKIIKLGMDTREVIARFEAERQALALMNHPNICQVFDAGATATGRPYFVMEVVRGTPLLEYCDGKNLTTRQRLELFVDVCGAIQHAHQKGIIHRDIKPSNVMVTVHGDKPVPKVIDFGIAKAIHEELTDRTLFTRFEQFVGTPAYMSPEQAQSSGLGIDTRSDVYSLGVLLYELLTGRPPFDPKELRQAAVDEIRRRIREDEPPKPSTQLKSLTAAELTDIARHRNEEPKRLRKIVHGELDWIVMKALEKEPARRYETAAKLSDEVVHFLRNEPVTVGAPSRYYRIKKFVCKHRAPLAAGTAIVSLLVVGVIVSTMLAIALKRQLAQTQRAQQEALMRHGEELQKSENLSGALLPYIRALQLEKKKASPDESIHRLRIESILSVCPRIVSMWFLENRVNNVAFAADGTQVVAASNGGEIDLLSIGSTKLVALTKHGDDAYSVVFDPHIRNLVTASKDGEVRLLRHSDRRTLFSFFHDDPVRGASFDTTGSRVVTASDDGVARLWDADDGGLLRSFGPPGPWAGYSVRLMETADPSAVPHQGNRQIVVVKVDAGLRFRVFDEEGRIRFPHYRARLLRLASGDRPSQVHERELVVDEGDDMTRLWIFNGRGRQPERISENAFLNHPEARETFDRIVGDMPSGEERSMQKDEVELLDAVGRLTGFLLSSGAAEHESARLSDRLRDHWEVGAPAEADRSDVLRSVGVILRHKPGLFDARVSPDGAWVVTAGRDANSACVWNVADGTLRYELKHSSWVYTASFNGAGNRIVTASFDRSACIWDADTGRLLHRLSHAFGVGDAEFSPDGRYVLTASMDYGLRMWETDSGTTAAPTMWHETYLTDAAFSPEGRRIVSATVNGVIRIYDLASTNWKPEPVGGQAREPPPISEVSPIKARSDGGSTAEVDGDRVIVQRAEGRGEVAFKIEEPISLLLFNPATDSQLAVVGTSRAWLVSLEPRHMSALEHENVRNEPSFHITHAEFSPGGDLLVTAARDRDLNPLYAKVWNTKNGKPFGSPLRHNDGLHHATFNSDGTLLVTSSEDKTAALWERAGDGFVRRHLLQHRHEVYGADFSPDDRLIVSYGRDGAIRVWETGNVYPVTPWVDRWWGYDIITKPRFVDDRGIIVRRANGLEAYLKLNSTTLSVEQLLVHAQLLAGRQYQEGTMSPLESVPLSRDELRGLWERRQFVFPEFSRITAAEARDWHEREAQTAEEKGNGYAAIFHLEHLKRLSSGQQRNQIDVRIEKLRAIP